MEEGFASFESSIRPIIEFLRLSVEILAVAIILVGIVRAAIMYVRHWKGEGGFHEVRLTLGHYLVLALEFQLASDLISTATAPTWDHIGKLAVVAVIRTGLNYFLIREIGEHHPNARQPG